jgi:hypothetical protein
MDRHEREARIAMVLVALPLPPLPVRACRGEDAADGVCSSHDLHAVMLATDMQRAAQGAVAPELQEARKLRKCVALNAMHDRIRGLLAGPHSLEDDETLEHCYAIVCEGLRAYWAQYAHACADVRVCELRSVLPGDAVYAHMLAYVCASVSVEPSAADGLSYRALFKLWLLEYFVKAT